ncbi:MAG: hypothetical protein ACOC1F_11250 [Myxococcota bacterium]
MLAAVVQGLIVDDDLALGLGEVELPGPHGLRAAGVVGHVPQELEGEVSESIPVMSVAQS